MTTQIIKWLALMLVILMVPMTVPNSEAMAAERLALLWGDLSLSKNCSFTLNTLEEAVIDLHDYYQKIRVIIKNESKDKTAYLDVQPFNDEVKILPGERWAKDYPVRFPSVLVIKNTTDEPGTKVGFDIQVAGD